jgi:methylthioribose-1-phosphate isomerase
MSAIEWLGNKVRLLDQTDLPRGESYLEIADHRQMADAIRQMRLRGAPLIGIAAAYGLALAGRTIAAADMEEYRRRLEAAAQELAETRPTAVNLSWSLRRLLAVADACASPWEVQEALIAEAQRIRQEDEEANRHLGTYGAELLPPDTAVLTHCNTGWLATGGYGTALGVVRAAWERGLLTRVYVTETRPLLQGARLTAWELTREGLPVTILADSAAGALLAAGQVGAVVVGADRIAANGDVANKVGTYAMAVLARENSVPFYVAAPTSSIDLTIASGQGIPIEERPPQEVTSFASQPVAPAGVDVANPAFDITPARYVTAIVTENGVARVPYMESLAACCRQEVAPRG